MFLGYFFKEQTLNNLDVYVCLIQVSVDKWMDITEMRYVIALRYNVILVSLTFFPLRSQSPPDSSGHRMICVGHIFGNHFVQAH